MGKLKNIPFEEEADTIKETVTSYWRKRTDGFDHLRRMELESDKADLWLKEIEGMIDHPHPSRIHILDTGCGSGFFEVLFAKQGYHITGIDLTDEMVNHAKSTIQDAEVSDLAQVKQMDAEKLEFTDETFDVVLSRNLTWTLPHPIDAYKEWYRVLKKGGILLNFDAEYAKDAHNPSMHHNEAHAGLGHELQEECHKIYHMLTISNLNRPEWDEAVLAEIGFHDIEVDQNVSDRIYAKEDEFQIPDRVFRIKAVK